MHHASRHLHRAAATLAAALVVSSPAPVRALDLVLAPQLEASYSGTSAFEATGQETDEVKHLLLGFEAPVFIRLHPLLAFGPSAGVDYSFFKLDTREDSYLLFNVGVAGRSELLDALAIQAVFHFNFGSRTLVEADFDLRGVELQGDLLFRAPLDPHDVWFEGGPYFSYRSLTASFKGDAVGTANTYAVGIVLQAAFLLAL